MKKILIVDDQKFMRRTLRDTLNTTEYEIIEAEDGDEATKKFLEYIPDVMIIDLIMPTMDGFSAIENIKTCYPEAKIIVVSSQGTEENINKLKKLGVTSFIPKPIKIDKLIKEIDDYTTPT
ncbi:MAG: response regulator [bacterium]